MSEKFKTVAEKVQDVYAAGYARGAADSMDGVVASKEYVDAKVGDLKENVYDKTEVNDLIASSHMVNITQMRDVYPNEAAIQEIELGEPGRGARYLVWVKEEEEEDDDEKLFYYTYNPDLPKGSQWVKGYQIKGSTLYLNLQDGCMYRYTNSKETDTYPHFIKMTISPATIEGDFAKKANLADLAAVATSGSYKDLNDTSTETLTFTIEEDGATKKIEMQVLVGSVTQK